MIGYINMMQIPYLEIWSMLLSGQVLYIKAIQVTCFGISRRPCAKHCPLGGTVLQEDNNLLVGLFHKLISMQDVGHNMLHLHAAQQRPSLQVHPPAISPTSNDNDQTISIWHLSKQNIDLLKLLNRGHHSKFIHQLSLLPAMTMTRQFLFGIYLNKILTYSNCKLRTKAEKPDIKFLQHPTAQPDSNVYALD